MVGFSFCAYGEGDRIFCTNTKFRAKVVAIPEHPRLMMLPISMYLPGLDRDRLKNEEY